jgi:hypothetical protein
MTEQPRPVCARCGKPMCPCTASIPDDKRICSTCRKDWRREQVQKGKP